MSDEAIGIHGAGAVGHMLALFLSQVEGLKPQLWGRQGPLLAAQPIRWQKHDQQLHLAAAVVSPRFWFCTLKAYALEEGLRQLMPRLSVGSQIIILSNGYIEPTIGPLRRKFPAIILRKGLVTRGVRQGEGGAFEIGEQGEVIWGDERPISALEQRIFNKLGAEGFQWNKETCRLRREKWFFNTCLNTLCGVHRLARNGLTIEQHGPELEALAAEVYELAAELWPAWAPNFIELEQNLRRLIQRTADNENSMAADVRLKRLTEAQTLSGLVRSASDPRKYPMLRAFDQQLQALD